MEEIITYLNKMQIPYETDADIKQHTWIHRGGTAKLWIMPMSCEQITALCRKLYSTGQPFIVVGQTSNIYFKNDYNPDIIISTTKLNHYYINPTTIDCECGTSVKTLSHACIESGYAGFEGLIDLPGTVAAAIVNNSSCYDCSLSSMLNHITLLTEDGEVKKITVYELGFTERSSKLKRKEIKGTILQVQLNIPKCISPSTLKEKAEKIHQNRLIYQEKPANTLGSIFPKNVYNDFENNLSFLTKLIIKAFVLLNVLHIISYQTLTKSKRDIILLLNGKTQLRPYISSKNFNCFIWKDRNADEMFDIYKDFFLKTALQDTTEIEIFT